MKDSIVFYKSFFDAIQNIPQEEQLKLYNAIFNYSFTGTEPEIENGIAKAMFILIKPNIDSANARYNASVENGKKGGRPKKETQQKPKQNLNVNVNVNENVNVNDDVDDDLIKNKLIEKITKCYEENIGLLTPAAAEILFSYLDTMEYQLIIKAIKIATLNNKRNTRYIQGILNAWNRKGIKTVLDAENEKNEFNKQNNKEETEEEAKARKIRELEEAIKNEN